MVARGSTVLSKMPSRKKRNAQARSTLWHGSISNPHVPCQIVRNTLQQLQLARTDREANAAVALFVRSRAMPRTSPQYVITQDGISLAYDKVGTAGPNVVLVHGTDSNIASSPYVPDQHAITSLSAQVGAAADATLTTT